MKAALFTFVAALMLLSNPDVGAQTYPSRTVKMVVPYPAGGGTDILARLLAQRFAERFGQAVVVENRTGASGNIGTEFVVKSPADGYTLLFNNDTLVVAPSVSRNTPYDVLRSLAPIGLIAEGYLVIGVNSSVPAKSLGELLALAKADPGKLAYASCGAGTAMHLAGELLKLSAAVEMTHVAYRGCAPAMQDSASGQVPVFITALPVAAPLEKQGKVRILATTSAKRARFLPNVPTVAESGFPGYEASSWQGLFAPAGTHQEIVARLSAELAAVVNSREFAERLGGMLFEPRVVSPEELMTMLRVQLARWAQLAKTARIVVD